MDTNLNNDASLTQDERATFGEYRTTTKVNGVQSEYTPDIDVISSAEAEYGGQTSVANELVGEDANYDTNFEVSQAASKNSKANDEDLESFNVFNSNDSQANEAIKNIKRNLQVYHGVLHHSIEPSAYNVNDNQSEELNVGNDNYSHAIDTQTLNDNYQNAESIPIIDTDAANENYQTTESTPTIITDAAADNNQNIDPYTIVDTSDAPEDSVSYDSANPEINDNPNVDTQIDATEDVKQVTDEAQISNQIIEDYNPNFTTTSEQIIEVNNEQEATQNFETTVTENENVFESKTPMVTPPVENTNVASELATSDKTYNLKPSKKKIQNNAKLTQKPLKTNPFKYKASSQTAPVRYYKSAFTLNEEPKDQPTTTTTTNYTQAAPLAAIPETNLKTSNTTNNPAQYTQTDPVKATESIIKPTTIQKDKPTTITGTYTPDKYTVYSQKNAKTTFEPVIKPPEMPKINPTTTITNTNTPEGYAKYFETTPVTMKPTTTTTTFTTTPTQYTTYSETGTMKPTTTTTTFTSTPAGYEKLFETTPAT
ncbi:MAG: hypothetical protein IKQ33_06945, partial [Clostridia bacterium]|nr:hypothetical protein [Clostridia bacterium]